MTPVNPKEQSGNRPIKANRQGVTGLKRQFFWSMMPLLVISVANLISVPLFYRFLGPEMYALWFYVNTLSGSFGFVDLGVGTAVGRFIGIAIGAKDAAAVRQYWGTGNLMVIPVLLVMGVVFVAIGVVFGPKWFQVDAENAGLLQLSFVLGGVGLVSTYYAGFWLILSQANFDFRFLGFLRSGMNLAQVAASLWIAHLTGNPAFVILAGVVCWLLSLGVLVGHARKKYDLGFNLQDGSLSRAKEMLGISAKSFAAVLVTSFGLAADRLLLGKLASPAVFAHYNICYNFGSRIQGLAASLMGPVFHQTSRGVGARNRQSAAAIYNETFDFTFGFYALAAIWTVFWNPVFLRLWLGPELAVDVAEAFMPMVLAFCLSSIGTISSAQLVPLNRAGMELVFGILNALCLGIGVLVGWRLGGLAGVAWGCVASRIAVVARDLYVIRLIRGGGWLSWHTWSHLLAQFLIGLLFFGFGELLPVNDYWRLVPAGVHGIVVTAWLCRHQLRKLMTGLALDSPPTALL